MKARVTINSIGVIIPIMIAAEFSKIYYRLSSEKWKRKVETREEKEIRKDKTQAFKKNRGKKFDSKRKKGYWWKIW